MTRRLLLLFAALPALLALAPGHAPADAQNHVRAFLAAAPTRTPGYHEALNVLARRFGIAVGEARAAIDPLTDGPLTLLAVEPRSAWRAADIRACHYRRSGAAISIGDCFLVAGAGQDDVIATADRGVIDVARAEGVAVQILPDSRGRRAP